MVDLHSDVLSLEIIAAGESVQRGQKAQFLKGLYCAERVDYIDDFVDGWRCERLNIDKLHLYLFVLHDLGNELLANSFDRNLAIRNGDAAELEATRDYVEDDAVRLAEVIHADIELAAVSQSLDHAVRVEKGHIDRIESTVLKVQVLELLDHAAEYGEYA